MVAGFIVIISGVGDMLTVQNARVVCLGIERLRVEKLPVNPSFTPDGAALVFGLVYKALGGVAGEEGSKVEAVA